MTVADAMTPAVTAEPGTPLREIAARMRERDSGTIVLAEDGRPTGLLTHRDLALALADDADAATPGRRVASSPVVSVAGAAQPGEALARMERYGISRLVVVEGGRVTGVVARVRVAAAAGADEGTPAVAGSL